MTEEEFQRLLPLAAEWVAQREAEVLATGCPLTAEELELARRIPLRAPEQIRLRIVGAIPLPELPELHAACRELGLITPETVGLCLRYGIYLRRDFARDLSILTHEMVHTGQYERLGSIQAFIEAYARGCTEDSYPGCPLEQEAIFRSFELCRDC